MADPLTQDNVLDESSREMLGQSEAARKRFDERRGFFKEDYFRKTGRSGYDWEAKRPPLRPFSKLDAFRDTRKRYESPYNLQRAPHFDLMYKSKYKDFDRLNAFFYPGYRQGVRRDPSLMYGPGWDPIDPHRYTQYGFNPWGAQVEGFPRPSDDWGDSLDRRHKSGEISLKEYIDEYSRLSTMGPRNPDEYDSSRHMYEYDKRDQEGFDQMNIMEAIRILHEAGVIKLSEEATEPSEKAAAKELEGLKKEQESGKPIEFKPEGSVIPKKVKKKVSDMEKENRRRRQEALD